MSGYFRSIKLGNNYKLYLINLAGKKNTLQNILFEFMALCFEVFLEVVKWIGIAIFVALFLSWYTKQAKAETVIPKRAEQYRSILTRSARATWGLDAPVAVFAAQIHTESRWRADAKSPVGAIGLAQFMPSTAKWIPDIDPSLAPSAPLNPGWSIRALLRYDLFLFKRAKGVNEYQRMSFALSGYNGGEGWVNKDKKLAARKGLDPGRWFGHVETVNAGRSALNWKENRSYPRLILEEHQFAYERAGWGVSLPNPEAQ